MKRIISPILILTLITSSLSVGVTWGADFDVIKNCVRLSNGEARLVPSNTKSCKSGERLISVALPPSVTKRATQFFSGEGRPASEIGKRSDFYIDQAALTIYGPKVTDSYWQTFGISFIGKPGPAGPIGSQGERGEKGDKGDVGATGLQGLPGGFGYYGSFYDTETLNLTQNQAIAIPIGSTDFSNGIAIENDALASPTKIRFQNAGKYNVAFSLQLTKSDSGTDVTTIWICKGNGSGACTNVPWSATDLYLVGNGARQVAAWNFFVNAAANDFLQIFISPGTSTGTSILASPAQSNPSRPEIPSTIVTVNQVG